jgi:hypothetical protein
MERQMSMTPAKPVSILPNEEHCQLDDLFSGLNVMAERFCRSPGDAQALAAETISRGKSELARLSGGSDLNFFLFRTMYELYWSANSLTSVERLRHNP